MQKKRSSVLVDDQQTPTPQKEPFGKISLSICFRRFYDEKKSKGKNVRNFFETRKYAVDANLFRLWYSI